MVVPGVVGRRFLCFRFPHADFALLTNFRWKLSTSVTLRLVGQGSVMSFWTFDEHVQNVYISTTSVYLFIYFMNISTVKYKPTNSTGLQRTHTQINPELRKTCTHTHTAKITTIPQVHLNGNCKSYSGVLCTTDMVGNPHSTQHH